MLLPDIARDFLVKIGLGIFLPAGIVSGPASGPGPTMLIFTPDGFVGESFFAYGPAFTGGVHVALGDVNGDGVPDIVTGSGPGIPANVKVFDGITGNVTHDFLPFGIGFTGGVAVAAGDIDGDGRSDIVVGVGPGAEPLVKVFDGVTGSEVRSFLAFPPAFTGGLQVAAGDVNGDGIVDIIVGAGPGAGPHVKVFDGQTGAETQSFNAFDPLFTGGIFVAAGDVNGDGRADVIVSPGPGMPAMVKIFDGPTGMDVQAFFPFDPSYTGGIQVAAVDADYDGRTDIVVGAGPGGPSNIRIFDPLHIASPIFDWQPRGPTFTGGQNVAAGRVQQPIDITLVMPDRLASPGHISPIHVEIYDTSSPAKKLEHRIWPFEQTADGGGMIQVTTYRAFEPVNILVRTPGSLYEGVTGVTPGFGPLQITVPLVFGDINGDNTVNIQDFLSLRQAFGTSRSSPTFNPAADLNNSGAVDVGDFLILRGNFGKTGTSF